MPSHIRRPARWRYAGADRNRGNSRTEHVTRARDAEALGHNGRARRNIGNTNLNRELYCYAFVPSLREREMM